MRIYKTVGVEKLACQHWESVIQYIVQFHEQGEPFVVFDNCMHHTRILDGDGDFLTKTEESVILFTDRVWAIFGEDEEGPICTLLLPQEY